MTLFVSDLDGTLIDSRLQIPPDSADGINAAISRGCGFAAATARTPATVGEILAPIHGALPAIVMNGAGVFDFEKEEYLHLCLLSPEKTAEVRYVLDSLGMGGFLYTVRGNHLDVYYDRLDNVSKRMFLDARANKPYKTFWQGQEPDEARRVFFCVIDSGERTEKLARALRQVDGLRVFHYRDVHAPDCWYVEIYDCKASKAAGVRFLKERYGFDEVVCFGDNLNDLPLFEAADKRVAVAGAVEALKAAADLVLPETDMGAVGRFIGRYENSTNSPQKCGKQNPLRQVFHSGWSKI